jgi:hypothetical protein
MLGDEAVTLRRVESGGPFIVNAVRALCAQGLEEASEVRPITRNSVQLSSSTGPNSD